MAIRNCVVESSKVFVIYYLVIPGISRNSFFGIWEKTQNFKGVILVVCVCVCVCVIPASAG